MSSNPYFNVSIHATVHAVFDNFAQLDNNNILSAQELDVANNLVARSDSIPGALQFSVALLNAAMESEFNTFETAPATTKQNGVEISGMQSGTNNNLTKEVLTQYLENTYPKP